jgi:topoisomerase-4 subunit A
MGDGTSLPLAAYAERAYLSYAMSVVRARALPNVEDGLKPVQRRILHAMNEMRLGQCQARQSARVVGDVIGKYHPHGDQSCTTPWCAWRNLHAALSADRRPGQLRLARRRRRRGHALHRMPPDAFRRLLLAEIDRGTVDFTANYDGSIPSRN